MSPIKFNKVEPGHWRSSVGDAASLNDYVDVIEKATRIDGVFRTSYVLFDHGRTIVECPALDDPQMIKAALECLELRPVKSRRDLVGQKFTDFLYLYGCPICYHKDTLAVARLIGVKTANPNADFVCQCGHKGKLVCRVADGGSVEFLVEVKTDEDIKVVSVLRQAVMMTPCPKCGQHKLQLGYVRPDVEFLKVVSARWQCCCGAHGRAKVNKDNREISILIDK